MKYLLIIIISGVWAFFAHTLIGSPALTGIGGVIIVALVFGLINASKKDINEENKEY